MTSAVQAVCTWRGHGWISRHNPSSASLNNDKSGTRPGDGPQRNVGLRRILEGTLRARTVTSRLAGEVSSDASGTTGLAQSLSALRSERADTCTTHSADRYQSRVVHSRSLPDLACAVQMAKFAAVGLALLCLTCGLASGRQLLQSSSSSSSSAAPSPSSGVACVAQLKASDSDFRACIVVFIDVSEDDCEQLGKDEEIAVVSLAGEQLSYCAWPVRRLEIGPFWTHLDEALAC